MVEKRVFIYPPQYKTLPDYRAHSGQPVDVLRELMRGDEYDYEGDRMFLVRAHDGWEGHVWESELL